MHPTKTLDDYQEVSRNFLLGGEKFRCLWDEPGVGKTGPAIMAAWETLTLGRPTALITCPAYLIDNWEREIHDFIPQAVVARADGTGYDSRTEALSSDADFVLTSYNNWSAKTDGQYTYGRLLVDQPWAAYIFDEGHRLRGRNSAWTKHVFRTRLSKSTNLDTPIWLLTGTPMVRDGGDFFPYFHLHDKKKYGSYWKFVNKRCVVVTTPWSTKVGNIRPGYANEFRKELAEFSLRRTVADVPKLQNLEFEEHEYRVTLPPSVVKMIQKAKKSYVLEHADLPRTEFLKGAGPLYVAQRQIATVPPTKANPKISWFLDFMADRTGKVVVYVWYKDSARAIADALGSKAVLVTGSLSTGRRSSVVEQWKDPDGPQILIATIPSLKEGISLTEASDIVFLEHSELPADIEQCIKRLCRRGQGKVVQVHHVRARQSVDMAIAATLQGRFQGITDALAAWVDTENEEWFT